MKLADLRPDQVFLSNKVGRRIFIVFIVCAVLPLGLMALISYLQVTSHLSRQADERLHQACKNAGMALLERLALLESDLDMAGALWQLNLQEQPLLLQDSVLQQRISARFEWISLQTEAGVILAGNRPEASPFFPTADELTHLLGNNTLVATRMEDGGKAGVFLARSFPSAGAERRLLVGEIKQGYLWGGEGFLPALTEIAVLSSSRDVLFSSLSGQPPLQQLALAMEVSNAAGDFEWEAAGLRYNARYWVLFMHPTYWDNWIVIANERRDDVLAPLRSFRNIFMLVFFLTICVVAFLSLKEIRRRTGPIEQLQEATRKIAAKDFYTRVRIETGDEFQELGASFNEMAERLGAHVTTIETVNTIGKSLTAEQSEDLLLDLILNGARHLANADGGALVLQSEDGRLHLALMEIDSLGFRVRNDSGPAAEAWLALAEGVSGTASSTLDGRTRQCADTYASTDHDFSSLHEFDGRSGYRTQSWLSVPLRNHENEIIGTLQLFNARETLTGATIPFSDEDVRLAESLASQAAIVLTKNRLVDEFRKLFEGLTDLIATAVDAKSPHTGFHCKRVPVLAMMIAEAACRTTEGALRDFTLSNDEMYELRIAAQLHDCGKVATPVHISDKATKLETIFDRIRLIETRFEILRRDRRIELLEERILYAGEEDPAFRITEIEAEMDRFVEQLKQDLEFLRSCNQGTEFMPPSSRQRVEEIASRYSWSSMNDEISSILTPDEVTNLTIPRGTLTKEEREVVERHVDLTYQMLEALPYPRKLRNVPLHAASHHERVDGKGYPFRLDRSRLSMQGRIIALADVFEALMAGDRPYRPKKMLSEGLRILQIMRDTGHLDPDLHDLFVQEKLYLRYAESYLDPSQIDEPLLLEGQYAAMNKASLTPSCSV